ncbi:MAG: thiamine-phosphate pyrophosphorylase [Actinomycetota bacterium]|nr:thiamine-phosphate pyrophosphorylase [Actinomycetota bacterium]
MLDSRLLRLMIVTSGMLAPGHGHRALADAAIDGGATAVQLRAPELSDPELLPLAAELADRCASHGVLFIVNDRVEVAIASRADGVHLGQSDDLVGARERLGSDRVLGISVAGPSQARAAMAMGADYTGVTVWSTPTKPEASGRGPAGIGDVHRAVPIPVVGIGGINGENLGEVFDAGASGIAVISAVAGAADPEAATRHLRALIDRREAGARGATNR